MFHTPLYRNSKEHHYAGLLETKFGAKYLKTCATKYALWQARTTTLRTFIGVETTVLTFRTKQYSTCISYSSHICYGKRFHNDFFLNQHTVALVNNCLKLLSCVVIETAMDLMKKNQLS